MAEMMNLSINKEMLTPVIEEQVKTMMATILGGNCPLTKTCRRYMNI